MMIDRMRMMSFDIHYLKKQNIILILRIAYMIDSGLLDEQ